MRDYASVEQLLVLANMEGMNAEFIHMGLPQGERLKRLNQIAIRQLQVFDGVEFEEAWSSKLDANLDDLLVHTISKEMLVRNKRATARAQDLADLEKLM